MFSKKSITILFLIFIGNIMNAQLHCAYSEKKDYLKSLDSNYLKKFKQQRIKDVKNAL